MNQNPTQPTQLLAAGSRRERFLQWITPIRWQVLGLILLTAIIYAPVLRFEMLNWDDNWYLTWNDLIKSWHPANLYRIMTEPVARNFAPVTIGSFLVEHTLWGLWPGGYHATNVLIHMINGVLVLQLMRQLTNNGWMAWTVAALFLVHPVQVESVAWVSSRKTVLSTTWTLASCLCWMKVNRTNRDEGWGILWLVIALLTKASAVTLPPIIVAYDYFIAKKKLSDSIARQAVPMFFCLMLVLTTMNAQVTIVGGIRGHLKFNKLEIFAIDSTLLWRYVSMLLVPQDLCVLYDPPTTGIELMIAAAIAGWVAVGIWMWKMRHSQPLLILAGISWLMLFFPVMNFFPITTLMNDRYLYLPCVPFFGVMLWLLDQGWQRTLRLMPSLRSSESILALITSTVAIGVMAWSTTNYLPVWKNPLSLWSYAIEKTPSLPMVHIQWATTLKDLDREEEALGVLQNILDERNPDDAEVTLIRGMMEEIRNPETSTSDPSPGNDRTEDVHHDEQPIK
ncbi:hypothetical protein SH668x_002108 [Planctomicrobium sp. SH668]|uniref:hypothetical protein n=1 Tax=Planctomicrobium sp. SH668 TaxID=3448126 RepID=UPI003F5B65FC